MTTSSGPEVDLVSEVPALPPRPADAHKGDFGRVLVVAGSRGMSGAAVLCGTAALRGGAGLVRLALAESLLPLVAPGNPCYMTLPLPEDAHGRLCLGALPLIQEHLAQSQAGVLGPGLGRSDDLDRLVRTLAETAPTRLVLDADALNALAPWSLVPTDPGRLVLTPHPGEFSRLLGCRTEDVQGDRQGLAVGFAARHGVVLILKGHNTLVTDGRRLYVNTTGNPGMATGGTGDVLAGLTGALLGQGLDPFAGARLAVYLHGLAGDLACAELGETSLIATDLLQYLPRAILHHR